MYVSGTEESGYASGGGEQPETRSMGLGAAWRHGIAADLAQRIGVEKDELMRVLETPSAMADYLDFQGIPEAEFHYAFVQAFRKTREACLSEH